MLLRSGNGGVPSLIVRSNSMPSAWPERSRNRVAVWSFSSLMDHIAWARFILTTENSAAISARQTYGSDDTDLAPSNADGAFPCFSAAFATPNNGKGGNAAQYQQHQAAAENRFHFHWNALPSSARVGVVKPRHWHRGMYLIDERIYFCYNSSH